MTTSNRPVVMVTGASTGLGLVLAQQLIALDRYRLVLTARASSMDRFAEGGVQSSDTVWLRTLDVTVPVEREAVIEEALQVWDGVDVLVNNAGVSYRSVVEHITMAELLVQMDVNFHSPIELARLVLPRMREKTAGRIINISSVGGMMAMPTMAAYSASKFALEGATEALWYEVKPWNIKVTLIEPGFINSSSFEKVRMTAMSQEATSNPDVAYAKHYEHMSSFIERMMHRVRATPEKVARRVVRTIERRSPPLRVSATADAFLFSVLRRLLPRRFYHWLLYKNLPKVKTWGPTQASEENIITGIGTRPNHGPAALEKPDEPPPP